MVMAGGALGSVLRYGVFLSVQGVAGGNRFPAGTLVVNWFGCFAAGLLWSLFELLRITHEARLLIFTGILGGFTTFSAFSLETTQLWKAGDWHLALLYVLLSNGVGIPFTFLGFALSRRLVS